MNKEIAEKWTRALRSGKYSQGQSRLSDGSNFCCLGVLCDISGIAEWRPSDSQYDPTAKLYLGLAGSLPLKVVDWAGMRSSTGSIFEDEDGVMSLADMNDGGESFEAIANLIETKWKEL